MLVVAADAATVFGAPPVGVAGGMLGFLLLWMIGGHIGRASLARFEREGSDDLARAAAARRPGR